MQKNLPVAILLSTYNGEKFIRQQLDSLLAQDYPDIHIFIRDDGSSDGTLQIVRGYADMHAGISVIPGVNLGFIQSFLQMLAGCPDHFSYYFFCDQDDVWLPGKVSRAVHVLQQLEHGQTPLLYGARLQCVDVQLNPIHFSEPVNAERVSLGNALVQNIITGCTAACNAAARQLIVSRPLPRYALAHDWWMYLVIACFGKVVYDEQCHILYRQHGANTIGMRPSSWLSKARKVLLRRKQRNIFDQVKELWHLYGEALPSHKKPMVQAFVAYPANLWQSLILSVRPFYWRSRPFDSCMLRVLIALRCY